MKRFLFGLFAAVLTISLWSAEPVRKVYVTRHGQRGEASDVVRDVHVSKLGVEQAQLLGKYLKKLDFKGKIYASPYLRTVETAVYAGREVGLQVYLMPELQEGVSDNRKGKDIPNPTNIVGGHTLAQFREMFPADIAPGAVLRHPWLISTPENGKSYTQRMMGAIETLLKENPQGDLLLVIHGGGMAAIRRGVEIANGRKIKAQGWNCSLYTYGVDAEGKLSFISYTSEFLPPEKTTSNGKYMLKETKNFKKFKKAKKSE